MSHPRGLIAFAIFLFGVSLGLGADDLRTLDGKLHSGELASIDGKFIILRPKEGPEVKVPLISGVQQVDFQPMPALSTLTACMQVELTDGSILYCKPTGFTITDKNLSVVLLNDQKLDLPVKTLSHVLLNAQDAKIRDNPDWKRCLKERGNSDMVVKEFENRWNGLTGVFAEKGEGVRLPFKPDGDDWRMKNSLTDKPLGLV
ncbi:MAG: hypothetical protein K2R98_08135, partial [Gemmataceae bacterium]|nr:hypothetical protein [Gemmataceae bacterium]